MTTVCRSVLAAGKCDEAVVVSTEAGRALIRLWVVCAQKGWDQENSVARAGAQSKSGSCKRREGGHCRSVCSAAVEREGGGVSTPIKACALG